MDSESIALLRISGLLDDPCQSGALEVWASRGIPTPHSPFFVFFFFSIVSRLAAAVGQIQTKTRAGTERQEG